jgi:uncharacterized membrane protein
MQRSWLIGLLVLVALVAGAVVVVALFVERGGETGPPVRQFGRRPPESGVARGRPGGEQPGEGRDGEGGMMRALRQAGAMDEDVEKVRSFIQSRQGLLRELREGLDELRAMAADQNATDEQVSEALATFRQKRDEVKGRIETERMALRADLDLENRPRVAAGLTALGVLDSGLPLGGGRWRGARDGRGGERGGGGQPQRPRPSGPAPEDRGS